MTYCIPLALIIPAAPPAASIRDTGQAALTRPGWAEPGQDHSGLWLATRPPACACWPRPRRR